MKSLLIAGNWKSNKTLNETEDWLEQLQLKWVTAGINWPNVKLILCASFTLLYFLNQKIKQLGLPLSLGAQDVSPFGDGAYTGAVNARQLQELAQWVIIGHFERRKYFGETDELLAQKAGQAKRAGLKVIFCVPETTTPVPENIDVVAYEPVWAIGTGKSDTAENAGSVMATIKKQTRATSVIYGGSVVADNIARFVAQPAIDGVLAGTASLAPETFFALIVAAMTTS